MSALHADVADALHVNSAKRQKSPLDRDGSSATMLPWMSAAENQFYPARAVSTIPLDAESSLSPAQQ